MKLKLFLIALFILFSCNSKSKEDIAKKGRVVPTSTKSNQSKPKQEIVPQAINTAPQLPETVNIEVLKTGTRIPFRDEGGVKVVTITVNNLPMDFIFDTGASLISISETEAMMMLKQGTITKEDYLGELPFVDANGDISTGVLINLKSVEIGGIRLQNIKASVVPNKIAPLLLGQSALEQFAKVTIDHKNNEIILE